MRKHEPDAENLGGVPIIYDAPQAATTEQGGGGLGLNDYLFILFRHKKKILLLTLIGLVAAAVVFITQGPHYQSVAKLVVPYIVERGTVDAVSDHVTTGGDRGMAVMIGTEIEMLNSVDLAQEVANKVNEELAVTEETEQEGDGAEEGDEPLEPIDARSVIEGLVVNTQTNSNMLWVAFEHSSPKMAVKVLGQVVESYQKMHLEIRRSGESVSRLLSEKSKAERKVDEQRKAIDALKQGADIISVEESKLALLERKETIRESLMAVEAELAEVDVRIRAAGLMRGREVAEDPAESDPAAAGATPSGADIESYREQVTLRARLNSERESLLTTYTENSPRLRGLQRRIDAADAKLRALEAKFPTIMQGAAIAIGGAGNGGAAMTPELLNIELEALTARRDRFLAAMNEADESLSKWRVAAGEIEKKQRLLEADESRLAAITENLEKAELDSGLAAADGSIPNIRVLQKPSAPAKVASSKVKKVAMLLAGGGLALGVVLALFIELFLDRSVKRAHEIESRLRLPLMLSIPFLAPRLRARLPGPSSDSEVEFNGSKVVEAEELPVEDSPLDPDHFVRPFADAIRDRLGYHFELNEMRHKPKLVGLTGVSEGAGTSTLATSLAAAFAETSEGKVLYLDLNSDTEDDGSLRPPKRKDGAKPDLFGRSEQCENLFIGKLPQNDGRSRGLVAKKLYELLPRFQSSDFDYVVFDMPPLGPTSPTFSMAGFMDKVLLVVDAGKTSGDVLKRYHEDLAAGQADVSTVLNKTRESLPSWLQG